ncbi:MAG: hypothetical protein HYS14_11960, partial [Candidatus Rokubacteria bacterium]|nr:hypothetical protein [Candidatus Rokubacteria bacterium]
PVRRPDKNWPKARYDELIQRLKRRRPNHRIAILGDPRGAYYVDGVPSGCLDLVNVDPGIRLDAHIAVLNRAALAVGGMSGGMVLALYCGCPSLVFGFVNEQHMYDRDNYLRTLLVYYPYMTARASEISRLADGMLEGRIPPPDRPQWDPTEYLGLLAIGLGKVRRFFSV